MFKKNLSGKFIVLLLSACGLEALHAAEPTTVVVPQDIYRAAGLDKLTDAERKVLLEWIAGRGVSVSAAPAAPGAPMAPAVTPSPAASATAAVASASPAPATPAAAAVAAAAPPTPPPVDDFRAAQADVYTSIVQPFTGWSGRTTFVMENGQVWQQRMDGSYQFKGTDTRVVIRRGAFGHDRMRLLSTGRWIGVKRIR